MALINNLREYERLALFKLGRYVGMKGPGTVWVWPILQQSLRIDLREFEFESTSETYVTKDLRDVAIDFQGYARVVDAEKAATEVENYQGGCRAVAVDTMRQLIGDLDRDDIRPNDLQAQVQARLSEQARRWDVEVRAVEIRRVR